MVHHSLAEEVPSCFSSASGFVNSSVVPSQFITWVGTTLRCVL